MISLSVLENLSVGEIVAIISLCVGIMWKFLTERKLVKKTWKKVKKTYNDVVGFLDFPRRILAHRMNKEEFLKWQDNMLKKIYTEKYFTKILGTEYPVYCLKVKKIVENKDKKITVDSLCWDNDKKRLLNTTDVKMPKIFKTDIMDKTVSSDTEKVFKRELMGTGWFWNGYKWFTARSMHDGNHIGYTLGHLDFDNKNEIEKIHLSLGDYKLNLLTSHIMTYELYKAYEKFKAEAKELYDTETERDEYINNIDIKKKLWPEIPFRRYIHHVNDDDIEQVLFTGKGRYSLLSVQCLVMLCSTPKGEELEYMTFFGKRSSSTRKVSTKLGCFQFPPSGGFDLYDGKKINPEIVKSNCSLKWSLMREYLEEIFGDDEFAKVKRSNTNGTTVMIHGVRDDPRTVDITNMLDQYVEGDNRFKEGTKKAYFTTVGANVDLIDLRLSVNFLLVINDFQYYKEGTMKRDKEPEDGKNRTFVYNEEVEAENKMLRNWESVDDTLENKRNIVEDSVALYAQGKQAFRDYLKTIVEDQECISRICNDQ